MTVRDTSGAEIGVWLSYPGRPAVADPDLSIYAGDESSILEAYRDNFDAVFILPRYPLRKGETYSVTAQLRIGGKVEILCWSFRTRDRTLWILRPQASSPRERLESVLGGAAEGDTVSLEPGLYDFDQPIVLDKAIRIVASRPGKAVLRYRGAGNATAFGIHADAVLSGLDLRGKVDFYVQAGCGLILEGCRFSHDDSKAVLAFIERGGRVAAEGCDFQELASPYLAYFGDEPAAAASPILYLGVGNAYGPLSYQGNHSFGPGIERKLQRPLE